MGSVLRWRLDSEGAGASVIIISPKGAKTKYAVRLEFNSTNNVAEYEAITLALIFDLLIFFFHLYVLTIIFHVTYIFFHDINTDIVTTSW